MTTEQAATFARELGELLTRHNLVIIDGNNGQEADVLELIPADTRSWEDLQVLRITIDPQTGASSISPR